MTTEEIEILKEKLPQKAYSEIAKKTGYSYETVRSVFRGLRKNETIIDAAIELASQYQQEQKERTEKIKAL